MLVHVLHFLLFLQHFLPFPKQISASDLHLSSANAFNLYKSTFLLFGKKFSKANYGRDQDMTTQYKQPNLGSTIAMSIYHQKAEEINLYILGKSDIPGVCSERIQHHIQLIMLVYNFQAFNKFHPSIKLNLFSVLLIHTY